MSSHYKTELEKLDTEFLPIEDLKKILEESFLIYTTSIEFIGRAHADAEYAEKVRESYFTLVQLMKVVEGIDSD